MLDFKQENHEYFEELCALKSLGHLTPQEHEELKTHLEFCASCRQEAAGFVEILHKQLPLIASPKENLFTLLSFPFKKSTYRRRFLAEAQDRGVHFSDEVQTALVPGGDWTLHWMDRSFQAVAVILILPLLGTLGFLGFRFHQVTTRQTALSTQITKLDSMNLLLRKQLADFASARQSYVAVPDETQKNAALGAELVKVRNENTAVLTRTKALEEQLQAASQQIQGLRAEVQTGKDTGSQLDGKLRDTEHSLAQVSNELQTLQQTRATESTTMASQDARIRELSEMLKSQSESLERNKRLLAAGRDIRDLMGARKLHIIDVFDVDGRGKVGQAFGRVFFTEGKSLIFYAYDLSQKKVSLNKASFQAWGYQEPSERSAQSLGIFYVDNQSQNRWVLQYEDSKVLEEINAVFVTLEPPGGSVKPTGHKLLYAFLNNRANHP
jgi:archaellum component FlaC